MITIGFNLEMDEGVEAPSSSEFVDALAEALPKEWWASSRCDSWGVTGLFPVKEMSSSEALALGHSLAAKDKKIEKLEALLAQERKLTLHLDQRLALQQRRLVDLEGIITDREATRDDLIKQMKGPVEHRDSLYAAIGSWKRKYGDMRASLEQQQALVRGHGQRVEDLTKMNHNQAAVIQNQQEKISQLNAARRQNPGRIKDFEATVERLRKRVEYRNGEIERTIKDLDEARKLADARKQTIQTMDTMLFEKDQKLTAAYAEIDELRDRGFTLSDDTLTKLETLAGQVETYTDQAGDSAATAVAYLVDLDALLDNIRTER